MSYQLKKVFAGALATLAGLLVAGGLALAQNNRTITGTVTDDLGEPLIGASVTVEGDASVGAITDLDGNYSITVPASAQALRFSYIGQEDAVEAIAGRTVINVSLASANIALTATVVTAMGIKKEEKSLSYNVQQAKLESVSPVGSFVNGLNGKVAGVSISQSSTGVGGSSRIVMRGSKSISNNNNALYVIDGIPMQSLRGTQPEGVYAGAGQTGDVLGSLNQDDIESISFMVPTPPTVSSSSPPRKARKTTWTSTTPTAPPSPGPMSCPSSRTPTVPLPWVRTTAGAPSWIPRPPTTRATTSRRA